jgi:hypothetical protein
MKGTEPRYDQKPVIKQAAAQPVATVTPAVEAVEQKN